jgi:hypothetical protein
MRNVFGPKQQNSPKISPKSYVGLETCSVPVTIEEAVFFVRL